MKFIRDFFNISKMQAAALIILCLITLVLAVVSFTLPNFYRPKYAPPISDSLREVLASLIKSDTINRNKTKRFFSKTEKHNLKPFNFDPNVLTESGFLKLGLPDYTVATIINYRNKGGHFYSLGDFEKMYNLSTPDFEALKNFVRLPAKKQFQSFKKYEKEAINCELNTADTIVLNKLKGIGSSYAYRIAEYRSKLGGFYSINQLKEIYGIDDGLIQSLRTNVSIDKTQIKRININEISFQVLSEHPYFRNGVALAICKYRKSKKDKIISFEEIANIPECTPDIQEKIKNYIIF
jgi:competence protein ComEA